MTSAVAPEGEKLTDKSTTQSGGFAMYSATRQWNPGDEFILAGARRIIDTALGEHHPLLYDRNPDVRPGDGTTAAYRNIRRPVTEDAGALYERLSAYLRLGFFSNSVKFDSELSFASLAVLAGSPEWTTPRCWNFYDHVLRNRLPLVGLGLGSMPSEIPDFVGATLAQAPVLTTRSKSLASTELARRYGIEYLPCPALLSSPRTRLVTGVRRVGVAIGVPHQRAVWANGLEDGFFKQVARELDDLFERFGDEVSFEFIAHYIDEIAVIHERFPGRPVRYSFASEDYADIFSSYDLVISTRVHACGMAASSGIPSISIGHDFRSDTTDGFLSLQLDMSADEATLTDVFLQAAQEAPSLSAQLAIHRNTTLEAYVDLISSHRDALSQPVEYGQTARVPFSRDAPSELPPVSEIESTIARVVENSDAVKVARASNAELRAVLAEVERSKAEIAEELDGARAAVVRLERELAEATAPRRSWPIRLLRRLRRSLRRKVR